MTSSIWTTEERGTLFRPMPPSPEAVRNAIRHAREALSICATPTVVILRRELEILLEVAKAAKVQP